MRIITVAEFEDAFKRYADARANELPTLRSVIRNLISAFTPKGVK